MSRGRIVHTVLGENIMSANRATLMVVVLAVLAQTAGCSWSITDSNEQREIEVDSTEVLQIGMVADSQIQSQATSIYHRKWKSPLIDRIVDVALRPPAQNLTAGHSLEVLLRDIVWNDDPDVVFFLGDGANNGCKDELDEVFSILQRHQKLGVSIFYVLGNHDYLGAGNTANTSERNELCKKDDTESHDSLNSNTASKLEVIQRIHKFNQDSVLNLKGENVSFTDNVGPNLAARCGENSEKQHFMEGCFYAGRLTLGAYEFFLLDTSNYGEAGILKLFGWELAGLEGAVCCSNSSEGQIQWLAQHAEDNRDVKRSILVSHFPPTRFAVLGKVAREIGPSDSSDVLGTNRRIREHNRRFRQFKEVVGRRSIEPIWLSGHTHIETWGETKKHSIVRYQDAVTNDTWDRIINIEDQISFTHINVGSTTDFRQHGLVVEVRDDTVKVEERALLSEAEREQCDYVIREAIMEARNGVTWRQVAGAKTGLDVFGLTKSYREWALEDVESARWNFRQLLKSNPSNLMLRICAAGVAAENESR